MQVCEGEISGLVAQLEASRERVAAAEAACQEARKRSQQLEAAATTAQETVERMQTANQDLVQMCVPVFFSAFAERAADMSSLTAATTLVYPLHFGILHLRCDTKHISVQYSRSFSISCFCTIPAGMLLAVVPPAACTGRACYMH